MDPRDSRPRHSSPSSARPRPPRRPPAVTGSCATLRGRDSSLAFSSCRALLPVSFAARSRMSFKRLNLHEASRLPDIDSISTSTRIAAAGRELLTRALPWSTSTLHRVFPAAFFESSRNSRNQPHAGAGSCGLSGRRANSHSVYRLESFFPPAPRLRGYFLRGGLGRGWLQDL